MLIGLFLPCSEYALFDGQLNCRRPALGKTGVFESLVLTTPGLKARPVLWCPKGDPGTLSEKWAKLQSSNSKDWAVFLLSTMKCSWMTLLRWEILFVREIGTHIWSTVGHYTHEYPRTKQLAETYASTSPALLPVMLPSSRGIRSLKVISEVFPSTGLFYSEPWTCFILAQMVFHHLHISVGA